VLEQAGLVLATMAWQPVATGNAGGAIDVTTLSANA
jgi:hypothetical protein